MSGSHTVAAGETLSGIAKKYSLKLSDLVEWNGIDNPDLIKVGQKIKLSGNGSGGATGQEYKVVAGDTFSAIGKKFGVDYKEIMAANGYEDPTKLIAGSTITIPQRTHKVVAGDTFAALGKKYGVRYQDIMKVNGYDDPTKLLVGTELTIPNK